MLTTQASFVRYLQRNINNLPIADSHTRLHIMLLISPKRPLKAKVLLHFTCLAFMLCTGACDCESPERSMIVTVTAYNSLPSQTDSTPTIAAWGDRLKPGMKVVAVSRDLLRGELTRGKTLRIEGLEGEYVVLDKTARRFKKRVDVYMGVDVKKAKRFGIRKERIYWRE